MPRDFDSLLNIPDLVGYYETSHADNTAYLAKTLFPAKQKYGLTMTHIMEESPELKVLQRAHFDTLPLTYEVSRDIQTITHKMPLFRQIMPMTEEKRQELAEAYHSNMDERIKQQIRETYDDFATLIKAADITGERMCAQILTTGKIDIQNTSGTSLSVEYGFDPLTQETQLAGPALWANTATSQPLNDLIAAKKASKIKGYAAAYMTSNTFAKLKTSDSLRNTLFKDLALDAYVRSQPILDYIRLELKINIIIVDEVMIGGLQVATTYLDETNALQEFFKDDVVTLWPMGSLGTHWYGVTPEELDLRNKTSRSTEVSKVGVGTAVVLHTDPGPPVKITTTVSMICLPSAPRIKMLHILKTA